jgi:hypothetical protein
MYCKGGCGLLLLSGEMGVGSAQRQSVLKGKAVDNV